MILTEVYAEKCVISLEIGPKLFLNYGFNT